MSLYLSKTLAMLAYPLSLTFLLALIAALAFWRKWRRFGAASLGLAMAVLWLCSTPFVAHALRASLENQFPPQPLAELAPTDAVVVLGGSLSGPRPPYSFYINMDDDVDRLWHAARLYRAGKAEQVIVVGGNVPWSDELRPETELAVEVLQQLGVPRSAMLLETRSANTYQNARYSKTLLAERQAYLVTSAIHMPRALATFRAAGMDVLPAAVDYLTPSRASLWHWLPDAGALNATTYAFKEYLGWTYYKLRGWAD